MDAVQYNCPNCGAELKFNPSTQQLDCEFCRSEFTIEKIKEIYAEAKSESAEEAALKNEFESHTNLYYCSNCGAEIMVEDNTTAAFCYYCHSPIVLSGRLTGDFRPSKIIGFHLTRDQAIQSLKDWCGKRKFIPKDFNTEQQLEKMTGIYVSFWVADCDIVADYHAMGKKIRSWSSGDYRYTEIREYSVKRTAEIRVEGVPADGQSKIEDALMEAIEPFDYNELKPFDMSYFSGFLADKYDIDKAGVFPRIRDRVTQAGKNIINDSVGGYSSLTVHNQDYRINKTEWEYIMLPVWFMTYRYKDKIYEFAINGQTGKLAGTPPLDKKKLAILSAIVGAAAALIVFLGGQFLI